MTTLFFDEVHNQHAYDDPDGVLSLGNGVSFLSSHPFSCDSTGVGEQSVSWDARLPSAPAQRDATTHAFHTSFSLHRWCALLEFFRLYSNGRYQYDCFLRFFLLFSLTRPGLWWSVVGFRVSFAFEVAGGWEARSEIVGYMQEQGRTAYKRF